MSQKAIINAGTAGPIIIQDHEDASEITLADVISFPVTAAQADPPVYFIGASDSRPSVRGYLDNDNNATIAYWRDPLMQTLQPTWTSSGIMGSLGDTHVTILALHDTEHETLLYMAAPLDPENFVTKYNNNQLGIDGILYQGPYEDYAGNIEELRDWDESPSTDPEDDPFNEFPQGGEFAELGDFDETYQQLLSELLEPETLDYGHFLTAYQLDSGNLVDIGDFLFDTNFWTSLKNKFEGLSDPLSMIVSAVEIPFTLGAVPTTFKLGGIEVENGEGQAIMCAKHSTRYLKYSFGSIKLLEVWGTAKDYTNCDISIFLPYVGMRQIDPDLGVNSVLTLAVIIDVWTGDLNYMLEVNNNSMQNKYYGSAGVPYRWSGNCGNKIPIGKVDPSTPILNVAASLGSMAIGAGMMALTGGIGGAAAAATGGMVSAGSAVGAGAGAGLLTSGARGAMQDLNNGFSPIAQSSGNISGAIGYMDFQYPYLVIKRGVPSYPNNWRQEIGAPRYQEFQVSSLSGYTEFAEIHADAVNGASDDEKLMIEDMLKAGVIL